MQTQRYTTDLTYDPNETYEQFCMRRQDAVEQGRQAVRERRISGDLFLFYEYLIERVGGNRYTWVSEDTMAEAFQVDASTIKRWIAKLVRAGLIRRQRQFATSSRTYITAYDPTVLPLDDEAMHPTETTVPTHEPAVIHDQAGAGPDQADQGSAHEAVSFRRTTAPTFGADLPCDSIKVQHLNRGGGAGVKQKNQAIAPEIRLLLEREGVSGFYIAPLLQQTPAEELRAVSRYLDQQPNVRDRARLFAALAVQGFGGLLLAGRAPQRPPQAKQRGGRLAVAGPARADDHLKYVSGALAPYIQGGSPPPDAAALPTEPGSRAVQAAPSSPTMPIWQEVLATLGQVLPASEIATWFTDASLVQFHDDQAVIGTSNIFAREHLTTCYQAQIAQALTAYCGRPVQVQIELGGNEPCAVTLPHTHASY